MQELLEIIPSREAIRVFLNSSSTWLQVGVFTAGFLVVKLLSNWLQPRLQTMIQPGALDEGMRRTAVRSGALALVPLMLWLWLLTSSAILRHYGWDTGLLRPAMILAGALALIRMGVFVLRHSLSPGGPLKAWEGVLTITIWTLVALHILGWLPRIEQMLDDYAFTFGTVRVSLLNVLSFALSIAVMLLVALWLSNAIRGRVARSRALDESMKIALSKLIKFVLLTLAVLAAMVSAGIDITAFAVFGGALGVGLGLGLQRVVSNFVSGFILAFEGSIRPGDVISYGDTYGTVKALHTRHIVIRTLDGLDILVPNENLLTTDITNWSYAGDRKIRLRLPVDISYNDEPEVALKRLERLARDNPRVLKDPPASAFLLGYGDNGINLELRVWLSDPDIRGEIRTELYKAMWTDFHAAGITFPFPQRDVYIKQFAGPATSPADARSGNRAGSARGRKREAKAKPPG
ncbi:MAG: mechanosensitive ion channel [Sulfuricaulis sp.]|uniref:mechanosensitive ion channel family protein n=1 Tax=Sulfuricaulis sp. TaxID=2003553 RepID=UPI0025E3055E|nr:mechanosensitive ion channel domain-containing protein [Sulfuricaulis sp.]MCR4347612.1 mechanosensitive ion channel [Sulfuricaulis sp.]